MTRASAGQYEISIISCSDWIIEVSVWSVSHAFTVGLNKLPIDIPGIWLRFAFPRVHKCPPWNWCQYHRNTAVFLNFTCFTYVNNIILQNMVYTKIHLQCTCIRIRKKNERFIIISIPGKVHNLYARTKLLGDGRVYSGTSLPPFELSD